MAKNAHSRWRVGTIVENIRRKIIFCYIKINEFCYNWNGSIHSHHLFSPLVIKSPTNIKPVDDLVKMSIVQREYMMTGVILAGLIVYLSEYIKKTQF